MCVMENSELKKKIENENRVTQTSSKLSTDIPEKKVYWSKKL